MTAKRGQELLDALVAERDKCVAHHRAMLDMDVGDVALSSQSNVLSMTLLSHQIEILRDGGVADLPALLTLDGEDTGAVLRLGRFGLFWVLPDGRRQNDNVTDKTLARKGWVRGTVSKPAWAKITGPRNARGSSGLLSLRVQRYPSGTNYWTGEDAPERGAV